MTSIHTIGQRVVVTDVQESLFWVRYRRNENQLIVFADDTHPRWVTTACLLDYDTMASADKFGNISIVSTGGYREGLIGGTVVIDTVYRLGTLPVLSLVTLFV